MTASERAWWESVTSQELRDSKALADGVLDGLDLREPAAGEAAARAIALRQVLDDATFSTLLEQAIVRTRTIADDGTPEACDAAARWLDRSGALLDVFERVLALLGPRVEVVQSTRLAEFALLARIRRNENLSASFQRGTLRAMSPSKRLHVPGKA